MKDKNILIIGAGLCGSLLALRLGQRGYKVSVVEKRPDLRKVKLSAGRSINLAFSDRGIKAMNMVGIHHKVEPLCIPMKGRMLHDTDGHTILSPYSGRDHEYINSISREGLNSLLLNEAEAFDNVDIRFDLECEHVDFEVGSARFKDVHTGKKIQLEADLIIGTDGAGSVLRKSYFMERKFLFSFSQEYLTHGYKELSILPDSKGDFRIFKNALHIWPRGDYMLIALPNLDGSFTVTLFLAYEGGEYNFNNLLSPEIVEEFFRKDFPDVLEHMPNLIKDFFENPTSPLGTVKCSPWYYKGKTLLMGDAAHAIVPFYGQGMNASFEDVVEFDQVLDKYEGDWETIFKTFSEQRKKDTDAIADLAIDNFHEMKDHVANPIFRKKRQIEMALEKNFPLQYSSKYSMVTFDENMGYHEAMTIGRAQDQALLKLIVDNKIDMDTSVDVVLSTLRSETEFILNANKLV